MDDMKRCVGCGYLVDVCEVQLIEDEWWCNDCVNYGAIIGPD